MVKQPLSIIKIYFQLSLYLLDYEYMIFRETAHRLTEICCAEYYKKVQKDLYVKIATSFVPNPPVNTNRLHEIIAKGKLWRDNISHIGIVWVSEPIIT